MISLFEISGLVSAAERKGGIYNYEGKWATPAMAGYAGERSNGNYGSCGMCYVFIYGCRGCGGAPVIMDT
jgi:hypothetical protein